MHNAAEVDFVQKLCMIGMKCEIGMAQWTLFYSTCFVVLKSDKRFFFSILQITFLSTLWFFGN